MKKLVAALVVLGVLFSTPASAWYRGGYGYYGGYRPYYGGYGWGGYGAALGIGAGAALLGGVIGGAIASQPYYGGSGYYYGGNYYCTRSPIYDAWGNFIGYSAC